MITNLMAKCTHLAAEVKFSGVSRIARLTILSPTSEQERSSLAFATALLDGWYEYVQAQSFGGSGLGIAGMIKQGRTKLTY